MAENKQGKCLSAVYLNSKEKLEWECCFGHKWMARSNDIASGYWCPDCSGSRKKNLNYCHNLAKSKNGRCLSEEYKNCEDKLEWECNVGHHWAASFHSVSGGRWCPDCNGNEDYNINDCCRVAESKNGKCLSEEYINNKGKIEWQCHLGHKWSACFSNIKNCGQWCPQCATFKSQKELSRLIFNALGVKVIANAKPFAWLKDKRRLEIDIWIPELKMAIEYDGLQHFEPVRFGGCSEEQAIFDFEQIQKRDKLKDNLIAKHPEEVKHFIRFNYTDDLTLEYVRRKLNQQGIIREV